MIYRPRGYVRPTARVHRLVRISHRAAGGRYVAHTACGLTTRMRKGEPVAQFLCTPDEKDAVTCTHCLMAALAAECREGETGAT